MYSKLEVCKKIIAEFGCRNIICSNCAYSNGMRGACSFIQATRLKVKKEFLETEDYVKYAKSVVNSLDNKLELI